MNAPAKSAPVWIEPPRLTGLARVATNVARLGRNFRTWLLSQLISLLGSLSSPGMRPVGWLQAVALRLMGAKCPSNEVWIGAHVWFDYPQHLEFGRRITIGAESRLTARSPVVIGDDFLAAPGLMINTGTHDIVTLAPQTAPITIGPGVWCGARVTIGSGVTIGADTVIGSGSLVLRDLPARHLAFGVPCKPQRELPAYPAGARWSNFRPRDGHAS